MKQYSKDHLDDLFKHIEDAREKGQTSILMHIKDALIMKEHIEDLEETIDKQEERR